MQIVKWTLAALGIAFGLGAREARRFEDLAAKDIAATLEGPSKTVKVRSQLNGLLGGALGDLRRVTISAAHFSTPELPLFCEPNLSKKGRVRELAIRLDDFRLAGLRVERLEATIPDCRFDFALALSKRKIRLSQSGVGIGRVQILEKDLEEFILAKFREIKRVSVKVEKNRVFVKGFGEFLVIQTEFEVIAKLIPVNGVQLVLAEPKVFFGELVADDAVKALVLRTLNPVVDLDRDLKLYGAVEMEGVSLEHGILEAWGKTKIPSRPAADHGSSRLSSALSTSATSMPSIDRLSGLTTATRSPYGRNLTGSVMP